MTHAAKSLFMEDTDQHGYVITSIKEREANLLKNCQTSLIAPLKFGIR